MQILMRTLLLNYGYEPMNFISERSAIKLVVKNKVDCISVWDDGFKHGSGFDYVCGANLEFYPNAIRSEHRGATFKFCKRECADIFELDPMAFLYPSILRLKRYTPRHIKKRKYNRNGILKRDKYICQYCGKRFKVSELTIDHVFPKKLGGIRSWTNCVACCRSCNGRKDGRTPKMANMPLLNGKPSAPSTTAVRHDYDVMQNKHEDWKEYIRSFAFKKKL